MKRDPCLLYPPRHLFSSTFQLAAIADAVGTGDVLTIRAAVLSIDLDACRRHWNDAGAESLRRCPGRPLSEGVRPKFTVGASVRLQIGERDGWRCRYCSLPVVWSGFFKVLLAIELPDVGDSVNDLWRIFGQSPDHVVPLAAGGPNDVTNLVSSCGTCNYAKTNWLLEDLGLEDPRKSPPVLDGWTGLVGKPSTATRH